MNARLRWSLLAAIILQLPRRWSMCTLRFPRSPKFRRCPTGQIAFFSQTQRALAHRAAPEADSDAKRGSYAAESMFAERSRFESIGR
jgi:hypothetical protein